MCCLCADQGKCVDLSEDHKPERPCEEDRIRPCLRVTLCACMRAGGCGCLGEGCLGPPRQPGIYQTSATTRTVHREREQLSAPIAAIFAICDCDAHRGPQKSQRFPRQEEAMLHCDSRVRWKVASALRFRVAISEPKIPSFCGIFGDLAPSTRKSLAIAIDCAILERQGAQVSFPRGVGVRPRPRRDPW